MKKSLLAALAIVTFASLSTSVMAQGFYAGGSAGTVRTTIEGESESKFGGKIYGGYAINSNFAVELGFANLGKYSSTDPDFGTVTLKNSAVFGDLVGSYLIAPNFSVLGRVGIASTKVKLSVDALGSESESDTGVKLGLGLQYNFTPTIAVRTEWERYSTKFFETKINMNALTVGLNVKF